MSQFASRHFDGQTPAAGESPDVIAFNDDLQTQGCCRLPDKTFICVAGTTTKPVIVMGDNEFPVEPPRERMGEAKQHHRIHSAGHRHQYRLALLEQGAVTNGSFDVLEQVVHAVMLSWCEGGAMLEFKLQLAAWENSGLTPEVFEPASLLWAAFFTSEPGRVPSPAAGRWHCPISIS